MEYVLVLVVVVAIGVTIWGKFGQFTQNMFGNFNETLSSALSTGVCSQECFFQGYANAKK